MTEVKCVTGIHARTSEAFACQVLVKNNGEVISSF